MLLLLVPWACGGGDWFAQPGPAIPAPEPVPPLLLLFFCCFCLKPSRRDLAEAVLACMDSRDACTSVQPSAAEHRVGARP